MRRALRAVPRQLTRELRASGQQVATLAPLPRRPVGIAAVSRSCSSARQSTSPVILEITSTGGAMAIDDGVTGSPWTEGEVEAIVAVYFQMLRMQELGAEAEQDRTQSSPATTAARSKHGIHRIQASQHKRSPESYGAQALTGYKPLPTSSACSWMWSAVLLSMITSWTRLRSVASRHLRNRRFWKTSRTSSWKPRGQTSSQRPARGLGTRTPIKRDYLEREARNRSLGLAGELVVMEYEARRLQTWVRRRSPTGSSMCPRTRAMAPVTTSCPSMATDVNALSKSRPRLMSPRPLLCHAK